MPRHLFLAAAIESRSIATRRVTGGSGNEDEKPVLQPHLSHPRHPALAASAASLSPEMFGKVGFTIREGDVIYGLTQGKANEEIAARLPQSLSPLVGRITRRRYYQLSPVYIYG